MQPLLIGRLAVTTTLLCALPAAAATFLVDSTSDAVDLVLGDGTCATLVGECTLRAAVQETNALAGADDVTLPAGTYVLTLAGLEEQAASGDLDVRDALTIAGAGAAITIIDGNGTSGVFEVYSGSLALSGLTVRRGLHEASWAGGISAAAPLTLTDCVVAENHGFAGGGITAVNGVTIVGTTVRDNVADLTAGGLAVVSGTIRDSTFAGNAVSASSGLGGRDVVGNGSGTLDVANSTLGELLNFAYCDPPLFVNCIPAPDITLANVTVDRLRFIVAGPGGSITVRNSIVVTNDASFVSQGYNILQVNNGGIDGDTTGNQIGVDPLLGALADNGGPTPTRLPLIGSPALNAGNPGPPGSGGVACEPTDQRGLSRPIGPRCDIGAVESQCGDGVEQPGEPCDDGNATNGDGCDVNCTVSACGNGIAAPGEQCDDRNTTAGDCCSATCQFEAANAPCPDDGNVCRDDVCDGAGTCTHPPNLGPCDDGNPCTDDACTAAGLCLGTANSAPCDDGNPCTTGDLCAEGFCTPGAGCDRCLSCDFVAGCVMPSCTMVPPARASLRIRKDTGGTRDKVVYRWQGGPLDKSDFADPRVVTPRVCVYDASGTVLSALAPHTPCLSGCWTDTDRGYRYVNPALDPDGIASMKLQAGQRAKVRVKGKGANLELGTLPFTLPVRVRILAHEGGACFGTDFAAPVTNTATQLRARFR